jgi:DNA primase
VVSAARPLADMLWMRETEAASFTTPERRAALEARIGEITAGIGDETVRKYYRRDFGERLRRLFFGSDERPRNKRIANSEWRMGNRGDKGRRNSSPARYSPSASRAGAVRPAIEGPYVVASPQLAVSPIMRGHRAAMPLREALILQAAINHPWLLDEHLETLEGTEFRHPDAEKVKAALIDIAAHHGASGGAADGEAVRGELGRRGVAELVERIERAITVPSVWGARPDAAPADVVLTWNQLFALHRQWHSLIKELKDAEQALGRDTTEANYTWLQDIKARLSVIEGTEALVEGFGASSGRGASGF